MEPGFRGAGESDAELIEAVREGRAGAFEALHARYRPRVVAFARKRLRDEVEAEDVAQEVFLEAFRGLARFQGRSSLSTWLLGIAHHRVCRRFRGLRPHAVSLEHPGVEALASPEPPADRRADAGRMLERMHAVLEAQVAPPWRTAFRLHYAESRSTRSIGRRLGKSSQAVKVGLCRSRRTLVEGTPGLALALSA